MKRLASPRRSQGEDGNDRPKRARAGGAKPSSAPVPEDGEGDARLGDFGRPPGPADISCGLIVRYDEGKGYGFIAPDDRSEDIFFLRSELPPELAGATRREHLIDARVEFEVHEKSDGKLRARRLALLVPPPGFQPRTELRAEPRDGSGGPRRALGRILRFDRQKGYGFIGSPTEPEDVFFLPSVLPKELQELCRSGGLLDLEVEVEVGVNEEGKPRASRIMPLQMPNHPREGRSDRPVRGGVIISFDAGKGFGFIKPDDLDEDVFYLRSELPPEIREGDRDQILDQRVEFEVRTMPDGKMRAQRCLLVPPPQMRGGPGPPLMRDLGLPRLCGGKIRKFDRQKGYGFIEVMGEPDVFFLPSALPREMKEAGDSLAGLEVGFEFYVNEEGKPRARNVHPLPRGAFGLPPPPGFMAPPPMGMGMPMDFVLGPPPMGPPPPPMGPMGHLMGPPMGGPMGFMGPGLPPPPVVPTMCAPQDQGAGPPSGPRFRPGEVLTGTILRFNPPKGYGFLAPDELDEDIFFLRSEMPREIADAQRKEEAVNRRVEFEVRTMPDGKLRAQRMVMLRDQAPPAGRHHRDRDQEPAAPLDMGLVDEMAEWLADNGGGADYGKFASHFAKVKKKQLEEHFNIFSLDRGAQRIELPEGHPGRTEDAGRRSGSEPPPDEGCEAEAQPEDQDRDEDDEGEDGVPPDEPAIPLGLGRCPLGVIRSYDAAKGFGFVHVEGLDEDIFFPRSALPDTFHGKRRTQMPELVGVEVSVELGDGRERGLRAERVTLLLGWHVADRCWLLKRR